MAHLILVRHGITSYNEQGLWTGWDNTPSLTEKGREEARTAGEALKGIHLDMAYIGTHKRVEETLQEIKAVLQQEDLPTTKDARLNERNYGDFTAKNKWKVKEQLGEKEFTKLRRSWDYPIPNGESLKQVYERIVPYYEMEILPKVKEGKSILLVSSGNALRALVKRIEHIPDEKISELEIGTGETYLYTLDSEGHVENKEIRAANPNIP